MRKNAPYVNLEVHRNGKEIESFTVHTVCYLPKDSKISTSGEGKMPDNVLYRPLIISYESKSSEYDYFGIDFTIARKDIGLLERGVKVSVTSASSEKMTAMAATSASESNEGTVVDYEEGLV